MSVITGVSSIVDLLISLLDASDVPKKPTNKYILEIGKRFKKGINAHSALGDFLNKKQEIVPIGPLASGEENISIKVDRLMFESIFDELIENAIIEVTIPPGGITVQVGPSGTGTNADVIYGRGIIK